MRLHPLHHRPPRRGPHAFFRRRSFRIWLSRACSATSRLSRAFSSSKAFSRVASPRSSPPYFCFHRYKVCSLMPCWRQSAAVAAPASCSCSTPTICSCVNRLPRMLSSLGSTPVEDSHYLWTSFRGAGHEEFLKLYVAYKAETNFVDVVPQVKRLRLSLNMEFPDIYDPRGLSKDITDVGRWGNGDVEV